MRWFTRLMGRRVRVRFWIEAVTAGVGAFLFVLTLFWRDWIEVVFGVDPDGRSGALEFVIAAALLLGAAASAVLARAEWRRVVLDG